MGAKLDAAREKQCGKKIRYATRPQASWAARLLFYDTGEWCHGYHCEFCHAWHVGHLRYYTEEMRYYGLNFDWAGEPRAA